MKPHAQFMLATPNLPRRRFLQGLAAGGILLGAPALILPASAREAGTATGNAPVLSGTEFDLTIAETAVNFTGN
ncbi:MAG: twin-arginine translocation signal domain-containing protein, partial [Thiobacillus sp.]